MLESDFDLKVTHLRRDKSPKETYSQFFFRKGIRGAILRSTSADRDVARMIGDEGFPAVVLGDRFAPAAQRQTVAVAGGVPGGWRILDIGPQTVALFGERLQGAALVVWNGPMGVFEFPAFAAGTNAVAQLVAGCGATTIEVTRSSRNASNRTRGLRLRGYRTWAPTLIA